MRTETKAPPEEARNEESALAAHSCRVAAAAAEVAKRLGWSADRQRMLRDAALVHRHSAAGVEHRFLNRLVADVWGYSQSEAEPAVHQDEETNRLLEMCCFFVQRWEFIPYELASYSDTVAELQAMAQDGFFPARHVECLASVPAVTLAQVREVVARLPVFPEAALKAMKVARNSMASAGDVEAVAGSDPVLAGEVLRIANSPLYSLAMPVRSIRHAVALMGFPECCRMMAAAAFRPLFVSPLVRPLWSHSMEVAKLAEALARASGNTDPEEAFLTGLMHDIGRLALWKLPARLTTQYAALLEQGCEPMFAETLLASFDHAVAGREVMLHWNLAPRMIEAVEFHHHPERSDSILTQVLYLAEHCSGSQEDIPSIARYKRALDRTGLDRRQLLTFVAAGGSRG